MQAMFHGFRGLGAYRPRGLGVYQVYPIPPNSKPETLHVGGPSNSHHKQKHNKKHQQHRNLLVLTFVLMIVLSLVLNFMLVIVLFFWCFLCSCLCFFW